MLRGMLTGSYDDVTGKGRWGWGSLDRVVREGSSEEATLALSPEESAMQIPASKMGYVVCRAQCKGFFIQKLLRSSRQGQQGIKQSVGPF